MLVVVDQDSTKVILNRFHQFYTYDIFIIRLQQNRKITGGCHGTIFTKKIYQSTLLDFFFVYPTTIGMISYALYRPSLQSILGLFVTFGIDSVIAAFLFRFLRNMDYLKNITGYCKQAGYSIKELEEDFQCGSQISKRMFNGEKWLFYFGVRSMPEVLKKENVQFIQFVCKGYGKYRRSYTYCYTYDKQTIKISCSLKNYLKLTKIFTPYQEMNRMLLHIVSHKKVQLIRLFIIIALLSQISFFTFFHMTSDQMTSISVFLFLVYSFGILLVTLRNPMKKVKQYYKKTKLVRRN